jgi:hypothetical protein
MKVSARDKDRILRTGQDDALKFGRFGDKIEVVIQFLERRAVKNIRRRIRPVEYEEANPVVSNTPMDEFETPFLRRA